MLDTATVTAVITSATTVGVALVAYRQAMALRARELGQQSDAARATVEVKRLEVGAGTEDHLWTEIARLSGMLERTGDRRLDCEKALAQARADCVVLRAENDALRGDVKRFEETFDHLGIAVLGEHGHMPTLPPPRDDGPTISD